MLLILFAIPTKMKLLTVAVIFLVFFQNACAVQKCYVCEGTTCKDNPLTTEKCEEALPNADHYLCESRVIDGVTKKGCIPNSGAVIQECDALNLNANTACIHCDRELCNSSSAMSLTASIIVTFILSCFVVKFVY